MTDSMTIACLTCGNRIQHRRGCCLTCYNRHSKAVREGLDSWDRLVGQGLALAVKATPWRFNNRYVART